MSQRNPIRRTLATIVCAASLVVVAGCGGAKKKAPPVVLAPKYTPQPKRVVPAWLEGSIFEQVDLINTEPYRVSNFGLVTLKNPTGDARRVPRNVREYMIREMVTRGFGSANQPGFEKLQPEQVLDDPRVAIVRVDGFVPAGAYKGQRVDVQVSALEDSDTTSLAGGSLFRVDLSPNGANLRNPGNTVDVYAAARGYVFVNPAYALESKPDEAVERRSLTSGVVLNGGMIMRDRPLGLLIRAAEGRISKMTEYRIDELVADRDAATAEDEGKVYARVPAKYRGDWEHFAGVILHTFYSTDTTFAVVKARELAAEAVKPDALLLDISYTWEALGRPALPEVEPLFTHPSPDVAFAAARAAAFIGSSPAEATLAAMARDAANPFRVNAVQTLVALPSTPSINTTLRELVTRDDTLVRVEAYRGLVRNADPSVFSKPIGDKYVLDIVQSDGPPLIYASRVGVARIAFLGSTARLAAPTFFTAMDNRFTISPVERRRDLLTLFYRAPSLPKPVQTLTTPDLAEVVARLGGEGPAGQPRLDFSYGEIVAILGKLSDADQLVTRSGGKANFVLQDLPGYSRDVNAAPVIPEGPRPIASNQEVQATSP